ncbi:MAG: T9SS type A sorting domain-containing protein [Crocinitomicaceae bacterium]|nr:T9SS type A sorting domain-containing protein [Crocinitomicaceae bacterium]
MKVLLIFSFSLFNFISFSQTQTIYNQKSFGTTGFIIKQTVTKLNDGNFILACGSESGVSGDKDSPSYGGGDVWIMKISPNQDIIWQKSFGGTGYETPSAVLETPEGDLLIGGTSNSPISGNLTSGNQGGNDYWLIKLKADGEIIWQNNYGGADSDQLEAMSLVSPTKYVVSGTSLSNISGDKTENNYGLSNYWVVMIDSSGTLIWDKTLGGDYIETNTNISFIPQSNTILVIGNSASDISGNKSTAYYGNGDAWLVELDLNGNILNQKAFGGTYSDYLSGITISPQNEIYLIGASDSPISGTKTAELIGGLDLWVFKLDDNLNVMWEGTYGGTESEGNARNILFTNDDQMIHYGSSISGISGHKTESSRGAYDFWMISTDLNGNVNWDKTIGGSQSEGLAYMYEESDNTYHLFGISESGISGNKTVPILGINSFWTLKLSTTLGVDVVDADGFKIYPNPADQVLNMEMPIASKESIQIVDITGKVVSEFEGESTVLNHDIRFLNNGMYHLVFNQNGRKISKKFVVQR